MVRGWGRARAAAKGYQKVLGDEGVTARAQRASVSPAPPAAGGLGPQGRAGAHRCAGVQGPTEGTEGSCVYGTE